jgi:hypothetical protein
MDAGRAAKVHPPLNAWLRNVRSSVAELVPKNCVMFFGGQQRLAHLFADVGEAAE